VLCISCARSPVREIAVSADTSTSTPPVSIPRHIRSTGTVQAVRVHNITVPQIRGPGGQLTLTRLIPNGMTVKEGDLIAEFDKVQQMDDARDAKAKVDDLNHQIEQMRAQNRSDQAKRSADLKQAEANLRKAEIELQKGEVLSEIDRLKNEAKAADAQAQVASLKKSGQGHDVADAAGLKLLELQRDRQQIALDRAENNMERLTVKAPIPGMVALEYAWRNGSQGPFQEGDQAFPGQPLLRIFDPSEMIVMTQVSEPDGVVISKLGAKARVFLDAYPGVAFDAHLEAASPVAAGGLQSPIRSFTAKFRIDARDVRILPDLSAAVEIVPNAPSAGVRP
jgi:multidrug resistance efflux pump